MSTTAPNVESTAMGSKARFPFATPIGVDVGLRNLLTLSPANAGVELEDAETFSDSRPRELYKEILHRVETTSGPGIDLKLARDLNTVLTAVAAGAIAYTQSFDAPILVLEELDHGSQSLVEAVVERTSENIYLLPAIQRRLTKLANESGVQVAFVSKRFTTRECHVCGHHSKLGSGNIYCQHEACPVDSACRDRSAAATIANRLG